MMTQSLDRRFMIGPNDVDRTPVLCNKYALVDLEDELRNWQGPSMGKRKVNNIVTIYR